MKKSRILALALALVMVFAMFAACGENGGGETTTPVPTSGSGTSASTTPAGPTESQTTPVTEIDVSGYDFTIMGGDFFPKKNAESGTFNSIKDEEWQEKYYQLEEALGITLTALPLPENLIEGVTTASLSSMTVADLIWANQIEYWPLAKAGHLLATDGGALLEAGLDVNDDSRWYGPVQQWSKLLGSQWTVVVASEYIPVQTGYFVTFNKDLCAAAGYDDMYKLVTEKKWNWEIYRKIALEVSEDTSGDNVYDIWGTGATAWGNEAVCNGVQYINEVDGKWQSTINNPAGIAALQFLYDMNFGDQTRLDLSSGKCREAFAQGTIAFNWSAMGHINVGQPIFNSNHNYGIIPMPMGPDADEYLSMVDNCRGLVVQFQHKDVDKLVKIMNEWALIVNDKLNYLKILDDGRCRLEIDKQMMREYIIPNFALNLAKMTDDIWGLVDDGIISGVSYDGMTPAQAVETYEAQINNALVSFFGY